MTRTQPAVRLDGGRVAHHDRVVSESIGVADGFVSDAANTDFRLDLRDHLIFPGLINAHDHLQLNNVPPLEAEEPFANSYEWIAAMESHRSTPTVRAATSVPSETRYWHGALKNILSGVTTVAHHDPRTPALDDVDFPVNTPGIGWCHSLCLGAGGDGGLPQYGPPVRQSFDDTPTQMPWIIHLAEGIDGVARAELNQLDELGCLASNTVLVHCVGLTSQDIETVIAHGAGVVWCPSSNLRMFGRTLDPARLNEAGRLALGTDSRLTGSRDLIDELRVAADCSGLPAHELVRLVTERAAAILRLADRGRLQLGSRADFVILRDSADPYEALLETTRADLRAVVRNGVPVLADPDFAAWFAHRGVETTAVLLDGRPKLMAQPLARILVDRDVICLEPGLELTAQQ
ncbi:MAG TPA: amidohydrolase family protein [Gemmatimonadaceae bacterium]